MTARTIDEHCLSIRDIVFNPLTEHLFLKSDEERFQIAACLDTIEDAQFAVAEYRVLDFSNEETDEGKLYLAVYGVLQAIFLQQDALMNLAGALQFSCHINDYPSLKDIREIRNQSVGHPTNYRRNNTESYYTINRSSLSLATFEMMEYKKQDDQWRVVPIDTIQTLSANEAFITQILKDLKSKLEADIDKHKAEFQDSRIADLFDKSLGYMCQKVLAGALDTSTESDRHLAAAAVRAIENMLCDVRKALTERGTPPEASAGIELVWRELQYPMTAIKDFYCNDYDGTPDHDRETVRIFAWYVKSKLFELRSMCQEIDEYYDGDQVT